MYERRKIIYPWEGKMTPFNIAGNVYFIGTFQASTHIIDTGDGLILIDPGYAESFYLVVNSIYELGYSLKDVKYILLTHCHGDHTEATLPLVDLSGAKVFIGEKDAEAVAPGKLKYGFKADTLIKNGDIISLGNTAVHCMETPGHTIGTISFFFDITENGKPYRVGIFGGAGRNTLTKNFLIPYPKCRENYFESIKRLKKEKVDIFIGNHVWNNNTLEKYKRKTDTYNPFIEENDWLKFLEFCENSLKAIIEQGN